MTEMQNTSSRLKILIVEDSNGKFQAVFEVVSNVFGESAIVERASTLTLAEDRLCSDTWSLLILDVSMDISSSLSGPLKGGHATLGGMEIARKMYLLGCEVDTIIVTAFDAFQSSSPSGGGVEILGLEEIERKAMEILGDKFISCIRYGDPNWRERLTEVLRGY